MINGTTGDFCGVIVAASPDGNSSYVVSSRDIFASIANLYNVRTGDDIPQISLPNLVESQQTPTRGGTMSDSDQAQITTLSHARPPHHRYDPHAAFSALTGPTRTSQPSTLEFVPPQGYQDNTHIENFRPTGQSSGGLLDSSSSTLPVQQESYARNEHDGELSQARNWSNLIFEPTANLMSHSISFDDHNLQVPRESGGVYQRPRTVAHFPSLQEERQDDIQGFPAFQAYEDTLEAELYGDDGLSGVGYGVDGGMFSGFTDDVMPPENSTMQYVTPLANSVIRHVTPPANSMMQYHPPRSSPTSEHNTGTGLDDEVDRLKMTESSWASSRPQRRGQQRTPRTSGISPLPPDVHAGKKRTSSDAGLPSSTQHAQRRAN